jgi:DNA-binding transcriptional ArsR family regulator
MAVKTRFKIFNFLLDKKEGVGISQLVSLTGLRQPTVTFHINQMVKKGIIKKKKLGRDVVCSPSIKCTSCPLLVA